MAIKKFAGGKELFEAAKFVTDYLKTRRLRTTGGALNNFKENILPISLAMGTVGVIGNQLDDAIDSVKGMVGDAKAKLTLKSKIEKIIALQPDLAQEDMKLIVMYYEQLRHFAPSVANNNLAAASYIKQVINQHSSGTPLPVFESLTKTQKNMADSSKDGTKMVGNALLSGAGFKIPGEDATSYDFKPLFAG